VKVPLSWLRELVAVDPSDVAGLARRLTMAGLEVEDVRVVGSDWRDVAIARVADLERHPRMDSLSVARLDLGGTTKTVVTAATNLQVGDLVPHVAPRGRLPTGEVGTRAFGGITSEGMVCSGDELDISPDKEGIYVFEPDAPIGQSVADYLGEVVLDVYITANRPDCMSMVGIAREVHALTGGALLPAFHRLLEPGRIEGSPGEPPGSDLLSVRIEDPVGCPRFTASVVRGIRTRPSPQAVQRRLHFAGVRPISNVVDVTNYVMLELGQPLHAFDRQRLASTALVIRRARPGESLLTLDGQERRLEPDMMVVADEQRARSLAGIMGGADSEIVDDTHDVVLEGANWDRPSIRLTSSALGLASEAARRFGRGVDPDLTAAAVASATRMTLDLAGGSAAAGLVDEYPGRAETRTIQVRRGQIEALLGTTYTREQVVGTLEALGFAVSGDELLRVTVPGWRRFDVEGRADLAEEVARVVGFETVPTTLLAGALPEPRPDGDGGFEAELRLRHVLASAGLQEVITYSLVDPDLLDKLHAEGSPDGAEAVARVANPQSPELSVLRPSLLGSLLQTLRTSLRQRERAALFELGRTWSASGNAEPDERRRVGVALAGPRQPLGWTQAEPSVYAFFDLKGIVEAVCRAFHVQVAFMPAQHPSLHPGRTAEVCADSTRLGVLGQLHPLVVERFDLENGSPVLLAELDLERLLAHGQPPPAAVTPSRFPHADRDISVIVPEALPHAELEQAIREAAGPLLEQVRLFDVYQGGAIPAGRKSMAYTLRYRAPDRTLADDEVAAVHGQVEARLRDSFGAEVRGR
jgi:phenylalanyl-tRNA synthetase beta chain